MFIIWNNFVHSYVSDVPVHFTFCVYGTSHYQ
jgi:hypothetical protein